MTESFKSQGGARYATTQKHKRRPEAHGMHGALSRFISRLGEKGLPFFKLLKASEKFSRTEEADAAFAQLKTFLTSPPVLTAPQPNEDLLLYIEATDRVISTVLVVERDEPGHVYKVQRPVYFISEVLNESKTRYPQIQMLIYAILITSRKLKHYIDGHRIIVTTSFPLGDILRSKDASGRIIKCAMELCPFSLDFRVVQPSSLKHWSTSSQSGQISTHRPL